MSEQKIRDGFKEPDSFIKLSEIEHMGRELSHHTQKLYLEQTQALLDDIDEGMLLHKLAIFFSSDNIYQWKNKKGEACRQIRQKENGWRSWRNRTRRKAIRIQWTYTIIFHQTGII